MDKIIGYSDWEGIICREIRKPNGMITWERFDTKSKSWVNGFWAGTASIPISRSEARARLPKLKSS